MTTKIRLILSLAAAVVPLCGAFAAAEPACAMSCPCERVTIKLAPMPGIGHLIPDLAKGLGYFKDEGIDIQYVNVMDCISDDFLSCPLLNDGTVDAEINWFHRVIFGIGNGQPVKAVFLLEHSPHMTISVANRLRGEIRSAADFRGRNLIDSEGFSTKRYLTDLVITLAGVPVDGYTPHPEWSHNAKAMIAAVKDGRADVVTTMEPMTSVVMAANVVTALYDLTSEEGTRKALNGEIWPARCLYFSPKYIREHPDRVQKLVNVFTRTMRYVNSHSADEIMAHVDGGYYAPDMNNDEWANYKKGKIEEIEKAYPIFKRGDYSIPPSAAKLVCDTVLKSRFDDSPEGRYRRAAALSGKVRPEDTYDNSFVEKAMQRHK
jgi:NitT/TauT family transport system substrate-binding protein